MSIKSLGISTAMFAAILDYSHEAEGIAFVPFIKDYYSFDTMYFNDCFNAR